MNTFDEVFKTTPFFEGENNSLKYESYRTCFKIWKEAQKQVLDKVEDSTYYDCNTGQQCFLSNRDLDDIRMEL